MQNLRPRGRASALLLVALLGLLPVLPILLKGSPVLNNDMLVAYFCYFWDFHRNWSWSHPLVFWSSSYQCGMPMHAYWQSGFLYPVTWLLFGPLSPHYGIYLFYAFHFALGIYGFLKLGPRLGLHRAASLWAGICFSLSGTMLARYEHATFLSGWTWIPLVLAAFLALRDRPGPKTFFLYAAAVALQALGGHPQASVTTAILIAAFTIASVTPMLRKKRPAGAEASPSSFPPASGFKTAAWILGGHLLAMAYCAPMLVPFLQLVGQTDRFDGVAWEGAKPGGPGVAEGAGGAGVSGKDGADVSAGRDASAATKLEEGVFGFGKFATGGMRPLHLLSLAAPHALGSPSNASWWGGEVWGEVFVYLGGLGLFFCLFASPKRANRDLRWVLILGVLGLWLSFGAHLGASQILYQVPVLNNFRRPARYLILFVLAMAVLSGHGFQRWLGHPKGQRAAGWFSLAALALAGSFAAIRFLPEAMQSLLAAVQSFKKLDPAKDYAGKVAALLGRGAMDFAILSLSAAALRFHQNLGEIAAKVFPLHRMPRGRPFRIAKRTSRLCRGIGITILFLVLLADLLRIHWDHFYLFPSDYYRKPPETARVMDQPTAPFWRVTHYLEYPDLELWRMHNDPVAHFDLLDREKSVLSCGIHAVFGYKHVTAHLPLMWQWDADLTAGEKSTRYLFTNRDLAAYGKDSLSLLGRFGTVNAYELKGWRPRLETVSHWKGGSDSAGRATTCESGFSGHGGICVKEIRDGDFLVKGRFVSGDTLLVRERFNPEWKYRVDGGPWQRPLETPDHFLAMPLIKAAQTVELTYSPGTFYGIALFCLVLTGLLAGLFRIRKRP